MQLLALQEQLEEAKASLDRRLRAIEQETTEAISTRDRTIAGCEKEVSNAKNNRDARLAELRKELSDAKEGVTQAWSELESAMNEKSTVQEEVASKKAELAGLTTECQQQNVALQEIRKRTDRDTIADSSRTMELWKSVFPKQKHKTLREVDEIHQLEAAQNYMEQHGLMFSDRMLKAFHTSLKVSDISPLVVLAGISGTGKSELPRRYAEAMNIHFLNMAVQPRWDSPQDMFGFFNYLEGRFRSTPLGRALIQMDPYHNKPDRGWNEPKDWAKKNSLADQMLLVLLDEMNLARIEYYFSEFLSRLETRRGINLTGVSGLLRLRKHL